MKILHLTQDSYSVGQWSGGATTELFIWPEGADYGSRRFALRVSSARVELAESDFTPLPGVTRWITPLTGGFTLTHPGQEPVVMAPLAPPYRFSGEIPTHCVGRATDFNLMLKGIDGEMAVRRGTACVWPGFNCYYAVEGGVFTLGQAYAMAPGDLLVVFSREAGSIHIGQTPVICCYADIGNVKPPA